MKQTTIACLMERIYLPQPRHLLPTAIWPYVPTAEEKMTAFRIARNFQDEGAARIVKRLTRELSYLTKENIGVLVRTMLSEFT